MLDDWEAPEPTSNDFNVQNKFGISTEDLFARYSYYAKVVKEKAKWENRYCGQSIDFQSILAGNRNSNVDPELKLKIFVQEKLSNGQLLKLTQNPTPEKAYKSPNKSNGQIASGISLLKKRQLILISFQVEEVDEFQIPIHVIKRKLFNEKPTSQDVLSCLPLSIEDIPKIHIEEDCFNRFEIFNVKCRLITFYGRICGVKKNERYKQRIGIYDVDDGTGRITTHFNHLKKEFKGEFIQF